jgi:hypothetical protein
VVLSGPGPVLAERRPVWGHARSLSSRRWWLLAVVLLVVTPGLIQSLLTALPGDSWVQTEAVFGLVGAAAVIAALVSYRSRQPH